MTTYLYSDDGHRQATINSSGTTNFVYDGDIILQETNAAGVTQVQYTQGPGTWGELSAQKRGSAIEILASDDRQNVRLVLSSSGAILDYNQYNAFLEQLNTPTQTNPFLGWGNENVYAEVLGLLRTGHRLIVPNTARFLNPDPLGFVGGDNNWFRLVKNNPLAWTDPSGLWSESGTATCFHDRELFCNHDPSNPKCPVFSHGMTGAWPNIALKKIAGCCGNDSRQYNSHLSEKVECGSQLTVSLGGCSINITVIDAGPNGSAASGAIVDLSPAAAQALWSCLHPAKKVGPGHKPPKHPLNFSCGNFEVNGVTVNG